MLVPLAVVVMTGGVVVVVLPSTVLLVGSPSVDVATVSPAQAVTRTARTTKDASRFTPGADISDVFGGRHVPAHGELALIYVDFPHRAL